MVTFEEVKNDLKILKHIEYSIMAVEKACEKLKKQYENYKSYGNSEEEELLRLEESIKKLDIASHIAKSIEKKEKYFEAISSLDEIQKAIIIDTVLNGVTYWQVANKMNYSEVAIKKRVNKAIRQIVEYLNLKNS